ncbi:hypothetical protein PIB30_097172, partial [Stylosanthes scabra]|nr:hypothetical protein [Stylosanthes scabra]
KARTASSSRPSVSPAWIQPQTTPNDRTSLMPQRGLSVTLPQGTKAQLDPLISSPSLQHNSLMIDFLDEHICSGKPLAIGRLLKWEKERESVFEYLETTNGGLKNYFKAKSEREFSASNAVKTEKGTVVNQPPEKKKEVSLEDVKNVTEKQKKLHGYIGEEDLTSVWSKHFPISVVAEEHFQSKTDLDLIDSVDSVTRAPFMQVYATRLSCIGRYEELMARREVEQKEEKGKEVQKSLEAERKLQVANEQLAVKEKEALELKTDIESLKGKLQKLEKDKTELEARVVELCVEKKEVEQSREDHAYDMMAAGFGRARKQAQFFFPDLKFDKFDPIKVVHNVTLVDDDEVDLEGGDDHNPDE